MHYSFPFSRFWLLLHPVVGTLIIVVLLAGAFGGSIVHATGGPSFGLQPVLFDPSQPATRSYFIFDTRPGTILHNRVRVTNSGTTAGTVSLYAVDATTGQTGGTVYLSHNDARRDVGAWLTLGVQHLTLAPGRSQVVPFQVTIPSIVRQGQHVGGIVAESMTLESPSKTDTLRINVQNLTIIAVLVNLPGKPIEQLAATGIQPGGENGHQSLFVELSNTGTMMLKPYGSLQVIDAQRHLLQHWSLKLDTFLPHTAIDYPVYVQNKALRVGDYQATLTLMYGHNHMLHYTTVFTITAQKINQVFKASTPLVAPGLGGSFLYGVPLWQIVLLGTLLLSGVFFWGQRFYRLVSAPRRRGSSKIGRS